MAWWMPSESNMTRKNGDYLYSSKLSLKAVLLHNGNQHPSIPVGRAVHMKQTYGNLKQLLNKLEYSKYGWHICGDLKAVSLLMGLQLGCMKYCCLLCEWYSRAKTLHFLKRETGLRGNLWRSERRMRNTQLWQNDTKCCDRPYTSNSVWWKTS